MTPEEISYIRKKLNITQEKFAQLLGVTLNTVGRWERGLSKPSPLALTRIESLRNGQLNS